MVEHQIDRTAHVDIDEIHSVADFPAEQLGGGYHPVGEPAGELDPKHLFTLVSPYQCPLVVVTRDEGLGEGHFGARNGRAVRHAQSAEWLQG